ncbi:hypothetical protein DFH09DRAFT_1439344 [Mycena vulgaris]|nr:hypothetical protein DFH09DRAFT_1439344 [Mycena vulgaris]
MQDQTLDAANQGAGGKHDEFCGPDRRGGKAAPTFKARITRPRKRAALDALRGGPVGCGRKERMGRATDGQRAEQHAQAHESREIGTVAVGRGRDARARALRCDEGRRGGGDTDAMKSVRVEDSRNEVGLQSPVHEIGCGSESTVAGRERDNSGRRGRTSKIIALKLKQRGLPDALELWRMEGGRSQHQPRRRRCEPKSVPRMSGDGAEKEGDASDVGGGSTWLSAAARRTLHGEMWGTEERIPRSTLQSATLTSGAQRRDESDCQSARAQPRVAYPHREQAEDGEEKGRQFRPGFADMARMVLRRDEAHPRAWIQEEAALRKDVAAAMKGDKRDGGEEGRRGVVGSGWTGIESLVRCPRTECIAVRCSLWSRFSWGVKAELGGARLLGKLCTQRAHPTVRESQITSSGDQKRLRAQRTAYGCEYRSWNERWRGGHTSMWISRSSGGAIDGVHAGVKVVGGHGMCARARRRRMQRGRAGEAVTAVTGGVRWHVKTRVWCAGSVGQSWSLAGLATL